MVLSSNKQMRAMETKFNKTVQWTKLTSKKDIDDICDKLAMINKC